MKLKSPWRWKKIAAELAEENLRLRSDNMMLRTQIRHKDYAISKLQTLGEVNSKIPDLIKAMEGK